MLLNVQEVVFVILQNLRVCKQRKSCIFYPRLFAILSFLFGNWGPRNRLLHQLSTQQHTLCAKPGSGGLQPSRRFFLMQLLVAQNLCQLNSGSDRFWKNMDPGQIPKILIWYRSRTRIFGITNTNIIVPSVTVKQNWTRGGGWNSLPCGFLVLH